VTVLHQGYVVVLSHKYSREGRKLVVPCGRRGTGPRR
jgi:hypothetical protein